MLTRTAALSLALLSLPAFAQDEESPKTFAQYEEKHQFVCNAPIEKLPAPDVLEHAGYRYEFMGATAKIRRIDAKKGPLKLGVLSAIKDAEPETFALLDKFFAEFEKQNVDFIVVGGDTAEEPAVLDQVYAWLVKRTTKPILTVAGNSERPAAHNHSIGKLRAEHPNLINMGIVRRVDADGADIVSLSGYYDARYLHMRGACVYKPEDLDAVVTLAKESDDPVVLLSHGPPKQSGKASIDFVPDSGNVGDPEVLKVVQTAKIPFGIHGHILEAGGKATDLAGKPLKEGKPWPQLFLNPGSANPLTWKLNAGGTSYGLAAVMTIDGKKASYTVLKGEKPAPTAKSE